MKEELMTMQETADFLGVSSRTLLVYRKDKAKGFPKPVIRGVSKKYFVKQEVAQWLEAIQSKRGEY